MKSQIESLLFIAAKPLTIKEIAKLIGQGNDEVHRSLDELAQEYESQNRGMRINKIEQKTKLAYQMVSNPAYSELIKVFTKQEFNSELTRPSLETLTIIAYRGPVTKPELEKIRGVNCSLILRNLMIRNLVQEESDPETGILNYSITHEFLQWLGIDEVSKLPDYDKLNQDEHLQDLLAQKEND